MNANIIRTRKLFFSWQDEQQEAWLANMSRRGLHLKEPGAFGSYTFVQGSPQEFAYCMDFNKGKAPEDYLQLIRDAGWEYLGKHAGWSYWRKEVQGGKVPDLFSDPESKTQKYQRLFAAYSASVPGVVVMYIIMLAAFNRFPGRHPIWFVIAFISVYMGWILFAAFNALMIGLRIRKLKDQKTL
jgi:hypothetical protein